MATPILHIGDPAYSSWSMRPWLALEHAGIAFKINLIGLDRDDTREKITAVSPSGTVPALELSNLVIWDSLAICEWAAERSAFGVLWPSNGSLRAVGRAVSATMHSAYAELRAAAPMNLHRIGQPLNVFPEAAESDLALLEALWRKAAGYSSGGPFLLGDWSIVDAMATPYATRIRSYDLPVSADTRAYVDALLSTREFKQWEAEALADPHRKPQTDAM